MKSPAAPALALVLLTSSCSSAPEEQVRADSTTAATASAQPRPAAALLSFRCESGETISVSYPSTEKATVRYKGETHEMLIAVSGSGARYVGDGLEWWTKGSGAGATGTLFRHLVDGTTGASVESCVES